MKPTPERATSLDAYQRRLIVFLSVACFFEGFDFFALSQLLPALRVDFGLGKGQAGLLVAVVNVGTLASYFLVRLADRVGRRPVLKLTIAGYTLMSLATALMPNVYGFALVQLGARMFLIAEWAVANVYAAEEFPADRRGLVIGIIQANSSLGAVVCAAVVPLLVRTPLGWRGVFLVGVLPLLLLARTRRSLRETRRFSERTALGRPVTANLLAIWRTPYRVRLLEMALLWGLTYVCTQTAITFWKDFAVSERSMADVVVGQSLALAAVGAMPFVFLAGRLLDRLGRRHGALLVFAATAVGIVLSYRLDSPLGLGLGLGLAIFGTNSVLPVLNAYNTELFPTALRSDAFAWANTLLGRISYVVSPWVVGMAAEHYGWSRAVSITVVFPVLALVWILARLPETSGRELEDTARLDRH